MTEIEKIKAVRIKSNIMAGQGFKCFNCGKSFDKGNLPEIAHQLIKSKPNLKKFGKAVIHHKLNLKATCNGKCNDAVIINRATKPVESQEKVITILNDLVLNSSFDSDREAFRNAFDNIGELVTTDSKIIGIYDILNNYFESNKED